MEQKQKKIINFRPLFYCFVAMLLALATARYVFAGNVTYIVLVCFAFFGGGLYFLLRKKFAVALVLLATFIFGVGWYFVGIAVYTQNTYAEKCDVVGRVSDDLNYSDGGEYFIATLKDVTINGRKERNISLQLWMDEGNIEAGDILSFESYVEKAKLFELGSFNNTYYRKQIGYTTSVDESEVLITGHRLLFAEKLRLKAKELLTKNMGEANGNIGYAMLFGDKSDIDNDMKEIYRMSGIIHILTVSGLHISFLFALLGFVLKKCRVKNWLTFLVCGILWLGYAYICGFSPSIIRAGVMGLVLLFAITAGKWYDNLSSLGLAGLLILLINPLSAYDVGFLMSFGCVFAIFTLYPFLSKVFKKFLPKFVADSFAISIAAELGILPFLAQVFGHVNYLAFLINLVVVPLFSIVFPILFVGTILSLIVSQLGFILSFSSFGISAINWLAKLFAREYFLITLTPWKIYAVVAFFVVMFLFSRFVMLKKKTRATCIAVGICLFGGLFGVQYVPTAPAQTISFCAKYGFSTILLTNKHRESVIINLRDYKFAYNLLSASGVTGLQAVFELDSEQYEKDIVKEFGKMQVISCESDAENVISVNRNETHIFKGFTFTFRAVNGQVVGLEISFDDTNIFVAIDSKISNARVEQIAVRDYDFVVLNRRNNCADKFGATTEVLGYYQTAGTSWSTLKDGNVMYKWNGEKYVRRSLD